MVVSQDLAGEQRTEISQNLKVELINDEKDSVLEGNTFASGFRLKNGKDGLERKKGTRSGRPCRCYGSWTL